MKHVSIELLLLPQDVFVFADARKIHQVFYNLLDNAIKFSEHDSSVTVEVTRRNDKIFVSIKDHGIGIPKKGTQQDLGTILQIRPFPRQR